MTGNNSKKRAHRSSKASTSGPEHNQPEEQNPTSGGPKFAVPAWITESLIELTLRVWQPYYPVRLTRDDALSMLLNVSQLRRIFSREPLS